jgi:hypothetical protein
MALFSECMQSCARKVLDTADIVREAWFRQLQQDTDKRAATAILRLCVCSSQD